MKVWLMQKTVSDQENYSFVAEFNSEDDAIVYMRQNSLSGMFKTMIPLHAMTASVETVQQYVNNPVPVT